MPGSPERRRIRAAPPALRAGRSLAARTGRTERFAEIEALLDRSYGRNRRDDAAVRTLLPAVLPDGATAIDVGANRGDILDDCGLRVFDLDGGGPYRRAEFAAMFTSPERWNWLAAP